MVVDAVTAYRSLDREIPGNRENTGNLVRFSDFRPTDGRNTALFQSDESAFPCPWEQGIYSLKQGIQSDGTGTDGVDL
jgi:hypothetical protein